MTTEKTEEKEKAKVLNISSSRRLLEPFGYTQHEEARADSHKKYKSNIIISFRQSWEHHQGLFRTSFRSISIGLSASSGKADGHITQIRKQNIYHRNTFHEKKTTHRLSGIIQRTKQNQKNNVCADMEAALTFVKELVVIDNSTSRARCPERISFSPSLSGCALKWRK